MRTIPSARSTSPAEGFAEVEILATLQVSGSRIRNPTDFSLGPDSDIPWPSISALISLSFAGEVGLQPGSHQYNCANCLTVGVLRMGCS